MKSFGLACPPRQKSNGWQILAIKLNLLLVDLDHEIEKKEGRLIKRYFQRSEKTTFGRLNRRH